MQPQKLTKSVIKDIVKECLVEILRDGINEGSSSSNRNISETTLRSTKTQSKNNRSKRSRKKSPDYLDKISFDNVSKEKLETIDRTARAVTSDPILSDMLADTAKTTLQEQAMAEGKKSYAPAGSGDQAQRIVEGNTPEELFGAESAGKWAQLAFGG